MHCSFTSTHIAQANTLTTRKPVPSLPCTKASVKAICSCCFVACSVASETDNIRSSAGASHTQAQFLQSHKLSNANKNNSKTREIGQQLGCTRCQVFRLCPTDVCLGRTCVHLLGLLLQFLCTGLCRAGFRQSLAPHCLCGAGSYLRLLQFHCNARMPSRQQGKTLAQRQPWLATMQPHQHPPPPPRASIRTTHSVTLRVSWRINSSRKRQ